MIRIQKYVIWLFLGVLSFAYAMNVEDDSSIVFVILPSASENWPLSNSSDASSSSVGGEQYGYQMSAAEVDRVNAQMEAYHQNNEDFSRELEKTPDTSDASAVYNAHEDTSTHDSYADSVLDSNIQDSVYWQKQREDIGHEPAQSTNTKENNSLPDRTYPLHPIIVTLRTAEQAPGYSEKLENEIKRIKKEMDHAWRGNTVRKNKLEFLKMMRNGFVSSSLEPIQHGTIGEAQKEFDRLESLWPWQYQIGFLIRNPKPDEQAFIAFIGGDVLKEAERCLASRASERNALLSDLHRDCIKLQMRGDLQGLQKLKMYAHAQLSQGRAKKRGLYSYQWVMLDALIADPVTKIIHTIVHDSLPIARAELLSLQQQVCQFYSGYGVTSMALARKTMREQHGFDLLAIGQECFQNRSDYDPHVEFASSDVRTMVLSVITDGTLQQATAELQYFEKQLDDHFANYNVTPDNQAAYMIAHHGYDVRALARALYKARPDCFDGAPESTTLPANSAHTTASSYTVNSTSDSSSSASTSELHIQPVQGAIIDALSACNDTGTLADSLGLISHDVFSYAMQHNYDVHTEIHERVGLSINTIRASHEAQIVVFHVAVVDRVLGDIQMQASGQHNQAKTLLARSPQLLARAAEKFVAGLNPIKQVKGMCEFLVNTAHFACDVTVGKLYLSHDDYNARIADFWDTVDALSPENLAQLSAENWIDIAAELAGGLVMGAGVYKTVTYLKEIEATSRVARQAAKIAGKLKVAIDTALAERPVAVTAGGMLLRMHDKMEEIEDKVVEVVRNSGQLLESAVKVADTIAQRLKPLGLGSTGRTVAANLHEQLVMEEIMSNPLIGKVLDIAKGMTDPRWHKTEGWVKMYWRSHDIEVHYVAQWVNGAMKAVDDFKFKN